MTCRLGFQGNLTSPEQQPLAFKNGMQQDAECLNQLVMDNLTAVPTVGAGVPAHSDVLSPNFFVYAWIFKPNLVSDVSDRVKICFDIPYWPFASPYLVHSCGLGSFFLAEQTSRILRALRLSSCGYRTGPSPSRIYFEFCCV
jgi:hypothetical protein